MIAGAVVYAVVEYLWTTDWADEGRRFVDPTYKRGQPRSRRR